MIPLICTPNYFNTFGFTSCYDESVVNLVALNKPQQGVSWIIFKKLFQLVLSGIRVSQSILQMEKTCDTSADQDEEHLQTRLV